MRKRLIDQVSRLVLSSFLMLFTLTVFAEETAGDPAKGKSLFNSNCASCHKLDKKVVGPALAGITEKRDAEWLFSWIRNNQELRESGDADAIAIFEEYNGSVMTNFPQLSDEDITNILAYTDAAPAPKVVPVERGSGSASASEDTSYTNLYILGAVLLVLVLLLAKIKNTLKQVKGDPASTLIEEADVMTRTALKNPRIVTMLVLLVAIILLQQSYVAMVAVGITQDYQPEQPIKFSHRIHAGDNKIDCNYCHYGARKSMVSNIPSASVCMNCHTYIQEGAETGTEEINKIYAAVGFDPEEGKYIEDYEEQPINWVRIHDLPDLSYFNHSQHVTAGNVKCQTCHGPVEEMDEVYQYSPLTMGWCVNCHRETEVDVKSNAYYSDMHEKLKEKYGADAKITVDMIGGLECGKCHY